jgi:hypothetical protein
MKTHQLIIFTTLFILSPISIAMSLVSDSTTTNSINIQFGLSGIVQHYTAANAIISINNQHYILVDKSGLTDQDLSIGSSLNYNVERSTDEEHGRITKVWKDNNE